MKTLIKFLPLLLILPFLFKKKKAKIEFGEGEFEFPDAQPTIVKTSETVVKNTTKSTVKNNSHKDYVKPHEVKTEIIVPDYLKDIKFGEPVQNTTPFVSSKKSIIDNITSFQRRPKLMDFNINDISNTLTTP